MSKRKNNKNERNFVNESNEILEEKVNSLTANMDQLGKIVENLASSVQTVAARDNNLNSGVKYQSDKSYIASWRDLGGPNLQFVATGGVHPVLFIKNLNELLGEAGVPEEKKVYFSIRCLRGSAQDWAEIKHFKNFLEFKDAFLKRYWGIEKERESFLKIKFGSYERGSRADYFLKLIKEAEFLSDPLGETELITLITGHFPIEVRRGLITLGLKTVEEVEGHLRRIDELEEGVSSSNVNNNNRSGNAWRRDIRNDRSQNNDRQATNNNSRDVCTVFSRDMSEILEEEIPKIKKIETLPTLALQIEGVESRGLIDSGSQITGVSEKFLEKILSQGKIVPKLPTKCTSVMGVVGKKAIIIKEQVFLACKMGNCCFEYCFLVIPGLAREVIFGCDFLRDFKMVINLTDNVVTGVICEKVYNFTFVGEQDLGVQLTVSELIDEGEQSYVSHEINGVKNYSDEEIKEIAWKTENLEQENKEKLNELLIEYKMIFSEQPGRIKGYEHKIILHDQTPFFQKSYPIPNIYKNEVGRQIREMIDWGVIIPKQTEYVSPLVITRKKDNTIRVCVDARFINSRMVKDHVMPPNPSEVIYNFSPGQVLTNLDLTASYWQIPIREDDQKYTGFMYDGQTYVFRVLPFGFSTSVGSFIRGLNIVLGEETQEFVLAYVDDLLVYSPDPITHLRHLKLIFEKFKRSGVTLKLKKCRFAVREVTFIGHILSAEGQRMDKSRISAIMNYPRPRNIKELRAFIGFINYDSHFCANYSQIVSPLFQLLRKGCTWKWGVEQSDAFEKIKTMFGNATLLKHPDCKKEFYIETDASGYALGAVLYQKHDETGAKEILAFASRTMQRAELSYTITEKEAAAVVFALKKWRVWVLGRKITIISDHRALSFLRCCRLLSARLTRWVIYLQEYDFDILYRKGSENLLADTLSRYPEKGDSDEKEIPDKLVVSIFTTRQAEFAKIVAVNLKNIKSDQKNDNYCSRVLSSIQENIPRFTKWFLIEDGILFRRGAISNPGAKLCVPANQIKDLILYEHTEKGHFGANKCFMQLKQDFFFPKMRRICRKIISSCDLCQKAKIAPHLFGEMHSIVPNGINEVLTVDLIGPLPPSRGGMTYLLVCVDAFSKLVSLHPLKRATATAILKFLTEKYFPNIGKPKIILSDNGSQFCSDAWVNKLDKKGIKVRHTSLYFPQGNPTERTNREIGRLLRTLCYDRHTRWATVLNEVQKWLNRTIHSGTCYSPEYLHYGIKPSNPLLEKLKIPASDYPELNHEQIIVLAHDQLLTKAEKRQRRHSKLHKLSRLEVGDKVLVRTHPKSSSEAKEIKKLFLLFDGPGTIIAKKGPNSFEIIDDKTGSSLGTQNLYNLKRYIPPVQS